jgi:hypothetical protein
MFEIRSEYGTKVPYTPRTYDMACRVAHFMRTLAGYEFLVCQNDRAVSEVFDHDARKDRYARTVARRFV